MANHMVGHTNQANIKDLRAIEERSLRDVLESALGMNLTVSYLSSPIVFPFLLLLS